jgi:hypothetical protein
MKRFVAMLWVALLATASISAQAPQGWKVRMDRSTDAADPDAVGNIKFTASGSKFHFMNPQAGVYWNPANTASGNFTLKGTFKLIKSTGYDEYYGLIFGGNGLDGASQSYLYFMVTDDGTYLVKRRTGMSTEEVAPKASSPAVKKPDGSGTATNALEVRVKADKVDFVVNGTVVTSLPRAGLGGKPDGIYGIRINHHLEVEVDGFGVTKM